MKTLLALMFFTSISASASHPSFKGKPPVRANQVQFIYEPYEDTASAPCTHSLANAADPYDLTVHCVDTKGLAHEFTVHLALSAYTHPTPPMVSYELMFWVNDNGATTWFNFEKPSTLMSLESSQSLTGESAGLRLRIKL